MTRQFLLGFGALYGVLAVLGEIDSNGRYRVAILAAVLVFAVVVERLLGSTDPVNILRRLGLGRPDIRTMAVAAGIAALLQSVYPVVTALTGAAFTLKPGWPWLLVGVFAYHGLAEELVWRGYAFRRLRSGRSFRAAVLATMPLIAATHLPVIVSSGLTVGVAAMLVAAVTCVPLAHLFETGRGTVWAPALVHTAIDSFKVVTVPGEVQLIFSLALAGISLSVPLLALVGSSRKPAATHPTATPRRSS